MSLSVPGNVHHAAFNKQALKVEPLPRDLSLLELPEGITLNTLRRAVKVALRWNKHEEISTGMLLVIKPDGQSVYTEPIDACLNSNWTERPRFLSSDEEEAHFRFLFVQDGGLLVDGISMKVLAAASKFFDKPGCIWRADGHGCKHNSAVNLTYFQPCVAVVRSAAGTVTIFIHEHTQQGVWFRLDVYDDPSLQGGETLLAQIQQLEDTLLKQNQIILQLQDGMMADTVRAACCHRNGANHDQPSHPWQIGTNHTRSKISAGRWQRHQI